MDVTSIPLDRIREAPWNPNRMTGDMIRRLRESLALYGLVVPLVVRAIGDSWYEALSGNQRLKVLAETGAHDAPCVIVDLNEANARLLAQALNRLHGEDDLAMKGALLREVLAAVPEDKVISLLPETVESLRSLASIGEADLAQHLQAWERAQAARLRHLHLALTDDQLATVEEAVRMMAPQARASRFGNPNSRGTAVYLLCRYYLEREGSE